MSFPVSSPDREQFKADALQWSAQSGQHPKGHPRLHQLLAYALWTKKRYLLFLVVLKLFSICMGNDNIPSKLLTNIN